MNTKLSILLTAIAGSAISAMPAQAFSFGTNGISFDEDTTVEFEVLQTYGAYKSDLKVYEVIDGEIASDLGLLFGEVKAADVVDTNGRPTSDPLGTAGNAVVGSPGYFTFEAGKTYTLGIENYGWWQNKETSNPFYTTMYSTTALNEDGMQRAVFGSMGGEELNEFNASMYTEGDPFAGYVNISFDDSGNSDDKDYQDFTLKAIVDPEIVGGVLSESASTPEPATLAGLGMVVGGMLLSGFRKKQN